MLCAGDADIVSWSLVMSLDKTISIVVHAAVAGLFGLMVSEREAEIMCIYMCMLPKGEEGRSSEVCASGQTNEHTDRFLCTICGMGR